MDLFNETLTVKQFAERTGVSVDNIYDWRRRGIDIGLGAAVNGRKNYSLYDVIEAGVLGYLRHVHYDDISTAFRRARYITPVLMLRLGHDVAKYPYPLQSTGRFAFFAMKGNVLFSDDPAAFVAMGSDIVEALDLDAITAGLKPSIDSEMVKG